MAVSAGRKPTSWKNSARPLAKPHSESKNPALAENRLYGRRKGRPLNAVRSEALSELLPVLSIPVETLSEDAALCPDTLFPSPAPIILEIGFGTGEHVKGMMERAPGTNFLACEPFENGMAAFLKSIRSTPSLRNVRVLMDDALKLCLSLKDQSVEEIYILNPDPWHKTRHHKRRIISPENLDTFARILKPGGRLILSTDVPDLADWMITHTIRHPAFEWEAKDCKDWQVPPPGWITTAYEVKGAKGAKKMCYLFFTRQHI